MGILDEICEWRQEERGSASRRYFYAFDAVREIMSGRRCFVIGRKGAGKTSIAEHVKSISSDDTLVQKLTFRAFPFNRLYDLKDESFSPDGQFITIWKFVIYCAICRLMARSKELDPVVAKEPAGFFNHDLETALSDEIVRLTDPSVNVKILSFGAGYGQKRTLSDNPSLLSDRVKSLERFVRTTIDNARYYILFDELDEDFGAPEDAGA